MTTTSPARPAWTAIAGRVAVPFTLAALCGRVIGKPARKSAPTAGRAAAPAPPAAHHLTMRPAPLPIESGLTQGGPLNGCASPRS